MAKRPTSYDVAVAAGVTPSTVSRTFSRPGRVNADTAARVRAAAEQLGYRSTPVARPAGTSGRTHLIAVVVSDVTNPFFAEIIRGAQDEAAAAGLTIVLATTRESDRLERQSLERMVPLVDGIVLASSRMSDSSIRQIAKQLPVIVLNRSVVDVPSVLTDNPGGVRRAAQHLLELGHRTITYVAGPSASWADGRRWQSLREAGIEFDLRTHRVGPFPPTVEGGMLAVPDLARVAATAVIAYNDQVAVGVMRALHRVGGRVPQDVSIVGFDNIMLSDLVTPGLTTVAAPLRAQGTTAVHNLAALIGGARSSGEPTELPTRLVVRGSTGQRRRNSTSPASWTTKVSGSASAATTSTSAGSR